MASKPGSSLRKASLPASSKTRVTGVTGDQTIKATAGIVWAIVFSGTGTLSVKDGASTLAVWTSGAAPLVIRLGVEFDTSIILTPSATTIDALVLFD